MSSPWSVSARAINAGYARRAPRLQPPPSRKAAEQVFEQRAAELKDVIADSAAGPGEDQVEKNRLYAVRYPAALAALRIAAIELNVGVPFYRVIEDDLTNRGNYFSSRTSDAKTGYFQRRLDDCVFAALATLLERPMHTLPDVRKFEMVIAGHKGADVDRYAANVLHEWLTREGLTLTIDYDLPSSGRWVGVHMGNTGKHSHGVVMNGTDCVFEPALQLPRRRGEDPEVDISNIDYAITIQANR